MRLAKGGDRSAFLAVVAGAQRDLRLYIASCSMALDVDAMVRVATAAAFATLSQAPDDGRAAVWLCAVAAELLRTHQATAARAAAERGDRLWHRLATAGAGLLAAVAPEADLERQLQQRYQQLPRSARQLLDLRHARGLTILQLAMRRGLSAVDIAMALQVARVRLDWLEEAMPALEPSQALLFEEHFSGSIAAADAELLVAAVDADLGLAEKFVRLARLNAMAKALLAPMPPCEEGMLATAVAYAPPASAPMGICREDPPADAKPAPRAGEGRTGRCPSDPPGVQLQRKRDAHRTCRSALLMALPLAVAVIAGVGQILALRPVQATAGRPLTVRALNPEPPPPVLRTEANPMRASGPASSALATWEPAQLRPDGAWIVLQARVPLEAVRRAHGVRFQYLRGAHRLDVRVVSLLVEGREVARDAHPGTAGHSHLNNSYLLDVPANVGGDATLRVEARSDGGNDSYGQIVLRDAPTP